MLFNMRIEGTLTKWNDERGFGFITPAQGGPEVFVHISAFPGDGRRPMIGERLTFDIEDDRGGKKRAMNLHCPGRTKVRSSRRPKPGRPRGKQGFFGRVVTLVFVVAVAYYAYSEYLHRTAPQTANTSQYYDQTGSTVFRCDGRIYCSQMNTCAEARFFLQNCSDVQMDGDHDNVPCEQQLCSGAFAR